MRIVTSNKLCAELPRVPADGFHPGSLATWCIIVFSKKAKRVRQVMEWESRVHVEWDHGLHENSENGRGVSSWNGTLGPTETMRINHASS